MTMKCPPIHHNGNTIEVSKYHKHAGGNSSCFINTQWRTIFNFIKGGLPSIIEAANQRQAQEIHRMLKKNLKKLEDKLNDYA